MEARSNGDLGFSDTDILDISAIPPRIRDGNVLGRLAKADVEHITHNDGRSLGMGAEEPKFILAELLIAELCGGARHRSSDIRAGGGSDFGVFRTSGSNIKPFERRGLYGDTRLKG